MSYSVSDICIYPVKSIKGMSLQTSQVYLDGLWGDRRYMIIKPNGDFITGREHPSLTLIKASLIDQDKWQLSHPVATSTLILDSKDFVDEYQNVTIWETHVSGQRCFEKANQWFSTTLDEDVELVFFGDHSSRTTSRRPDSPVAFADGYPFLLTTNASLNELNKTCPENIKMAQFRPNIVIDGNLAFEEDTWKRIKIGDVVFENVKPCARCIFTTINPDTAARSKKGEPMKSLGKFRLQGKEGIMFGVNLVAENTGTIYLGDKVEILEYQEAQTFADKR